MDLDDTSEIRKKRVVELISKAQNGDKPVVELSDSNFDAAISSDQLTLVDFWAPWCAPCRFVSPIIEELGSQYSGSMKFGKLNVDENQITSSRYRITSIPTIMFFRKGKQVDYVIGALPKNVLEGKIKKLLASA